MLSPKDVPDEYIIDPANFEGKDEVSMGAKMSPEKERMIYPTQRGPMVFPDPLDKPREQSRRGRCYLQIQTCCQIQTNKEGQNSDKSEISPISNPHGVVFGVSKIPGSV